MMLHIVNNSIVTYLYDHCCLPQVQEVPSLQYSVEPTLQQSNPPEHLLMQQILQKLALPLLHENLTGSTGGMKTMCVMLPQPQETRVNATDICIWNALK